LKTVKHLTHPFSKCIIGARELIVHIGLEGELPPGLTAEQKAQIRDLEGVWQLDATYRMRRTSSSQAVPATLDLSEESNQDAARRAGATPYHIHVKGEIYYLFPRGLGGAPMWHSEATMFADPKYTNVEKLTGHPRVAFK